MQDDFYTYEGRLASFAAPGKKSKAPKWPHKFLNAEKLAAAGFFYQPSEESNDNVTCFLCLQSIVGWEKGDEPVAEHLSLSPNCGWAIVASIEAGNEQLILEDPTSARMIEARKSTFGDRWPHDKKKGWKCKSKQMVDAGWVYKPTPEGDDMVKCMYCELSLDGFEPKDDPMNEHHKRSEGCAFFQLIAGKPSKQKSRKPRASKASRLSTQSTVTIASEAPSFLDLPAEEDDSVLTTATSATVTSQGGKKMAKARKGGKRVTKAKKEEPAEVIVVPEPDADEDDFEVKVAPKQKSTKGKKRSSDAMEDASVLDMNQAPAPKRRATRTRGSTAVEDIIVGPLSSVEVEDEMEDVKAKKPAPAKRGRHSNAKSIRKPSTAPNASMTTPIPNDDELDNALLADLERELSDEDMNGDVSVVQNKRRASRAASAAPARKPTRNSKIVNPDHAMFIGEAMELDDSALDKELETMQAESQPLPKAKGAKGKQTTRKPSAKQQAAAKRAAKAEAEAHVEEEADMQLQLELSQHAESVLEASPPPKTRGKAKTSKRVTKNTRDSTAPTNHATVPTPEMDTEMEIARDDSGNDTDASMASQSTIIRGGSKKRGSTLKGNKGKSKAITRNIEEIVHGEPQRLGGFPMEDQTMQSNSITSSERIASTTLTEPSVKNSSGKARAVEEASRTPRQAFPEPAPRSPMPPAKELTPSPSPQSSDAENQPPSAHPSTARPTPRQKYTTARIPLAESTPILSPSKRNIIAGLQSSQDWNAVDLDQILLKSPGNKENPNSGDILREALQGAKNGVLTSPERSMTVQEWIIHNANLAEGKLKGECERMVNKFESEGGKAMRVLEGIKCVE